MERWREHYSTTLNHAAATQCADLDTQANCALPSWNISSDPPTMEEIAKSIRKLNGRAAGPDDIHPELLMYAVGPISSIMHALFLKVWSSGLVPAWLSLYTRERPTKSVFKSAVPSIQLLRDLHNGTTSRVRVDGRLSASFITTSGVHG